MSIHSLDFPSISMFSENFFSFQSSLKKENPTSFQTFSLLCLIRYVEEKKEL